MKRIITTAIFAASLGFGSVSALWYDSTFVDDTGEEMPILVAEHLDARYMILCSATAGVQAYLAAPVPFTQSGAYQIEGRGALPGIWIKHANDDGLILLHSTRSPASIVSTMLRGVSLEVTHPSGVREIVSFPRTGIRHAGDRFAKRCESSKESQAGTGFGDTPLHSAIRRGDDATARDIIMISSKSVLCSRNSLGQLPIQLAYGLERDDIWGLLVSMDATKYDCP